MDIELVLDNQRRIINLMKKYEDITKKLLDCPIDDILMLTEKRKSISQEVTVLDNQAKKECSENKQAIEAYTNKCNRSELSQDLQEIFDRRQELNGIVFRIKTLDPEITERIELLRAEIVGKIKKNNVGQNAKAAKYAAAAMPPPSGKLYIPKNKKMI